MYKIWVSKRHFWVFLSVGRGHCYKPCNAWYFPFQRILNTTDPTPTYNIQLLNLVCTYECYETLQVTYLSTRMWGIKIMNIFMINIKFHVGYITSNNLSIKLNVRVTQTSYFKVIPRTYSRAGRPRPECVILVKYMHWRALHR